MKESTTNLFEEIKYSYTSLQMNLFFEYIIKLDNLSGINSINKVVDSTKLDINFGNNKYYLRNDYIKKGLESSLQKKLGLGILGELSILQSFNYIVCKFQEIIKSDKEFDKYINNLFKKKGYNYKSLIDIISLIRSISTHGSLSIDYKLQEKDFSKRKYHRIKEGMKELKINLNIVNGLHSFNLSIKIDDIKEGANFSKFFDGHQMIIFIEFCMNIIHSYKKHKSII